MKNKFWRVHRTYFIRNTVAATRLYILISVPKHHSQRYRTVYKRWAAVTTGFFHNLALVPYLSNVTGLDYRAAQSTINFDVSNEP
jgi:hypothetical protein